MKRLFSNKSGFTLAEIIVAIAIFSVMMAMIMQMLQLSIEQRNANLKFAQDLNDQEYALVVDGKDTTIPKKADGTADTDDTIRLNFVNPKDETDPTKPLFKDIEDSDKNKADGIPIDYKVKGTDDTYVDAGLNYFVGDYDYTADGIGGSGSDSSGNGAAQTAQYDTRITGTKGIKDIKVSVEEVASVPDVTLSSGQTAYKMTVSATTSKPSMLEDDIKYSQLRFYFYSTTDSSNKKVEVKKKVKNDEGEWEYIVVDTYYKKVYNKADLAVVKAESGTSYVVERSSDYAVRIGLPLDDSKKTTGFGSDNITFYLVFNGDPGLTASSFGYGSGTTYNCSPKYDEKTGEASGYHVNIYGSYPFETSKTKDGTYTVGGAK